VRRLVHLFTVALVASLLSVVLVASAALATEGGTEQADEDLSGFGAGDWDGLMVTAVVGLAIGIGVFLDAKPGEIGGGDHH
jgi:hypothetical protein